ncbi:MAG: cytochrome c3 family protein [Myxococcota bacterium]
MDFRVRALRSTAFALVLAASPAFGDLFSPGPLSRAHKSLEGISNCTQCHPAGEQLSAESCLTCHKEIETRLKAGKGLHGRLSAEKKEHCEECHHEHQGEQLDLLGWGKAGKKGFEHQRTGWPLVGAHARQECGDCHAKARLQDATVVALLGKQPGRTTFLGLRATCVSCHFDEHRGQVEQECQGCHDEKAWKPAPGFDHSDTEYPLEGLHKKVKCEECHQTVRDPNFAQGIFPAPRAKTFLEFAPLAHRSCQSCHDDPHEGRFGPRCHSCHTVAGWRILRNAAQERSFHEKTRFPLKGAHIDVECRACHGPFSGRPAKFKGLAFSTCSTCHFDAHLGQLAKKGRRPLCEDCHTVDGFLPARFGLEAHAKTSWPLEGAHQTVACNACHPRFLPLADQVSTAQRKQLRKDHRAELFSLARLDIPRADRCETCHPDVHAGQFGKREGGCTGCHRLSSFSDLAFSHDKDTRFPLTGAHTRAACGSCHTPSVEKGVKTVRYRPLETACGGCHTDVHAGQFAPPGQPTDCTKCHQTESFAKTLFVHDVPFTEFKLDGKHASLECRACHREVKVGRGVTAVRYRPLPSTCEGCHSDFHRGEFQGFEP